MTRDELDTLWQQALHESVRDGEDFIRYHFAAFVAAHEREACAKVCDEVFAQWQNCEPGEEDLFGAEECAAAIRARGNDETVG